MSAQAILQLLLQPMNLVARQAVSRRFDAMSRELTFLAKKESEDLKLILERGWSADKLQVLFALNSTYQLVLGPQEAASRTSPEVFGPDGIIVHGSFVVDAAFRQRTRSAVEAFHALCSTASIRIDLLYLATCRDIVYWEARFQREGGDDGGSPKRRRKRK